jgi:hypothetical protein
MSNVYKNLLGLSMLFIVALPLIYSAGFIIKQKAAVYKMQERLETASLKTYTIAKSDVKWIKKGREVLIDGKLFDLKSIKSINDTYEITGLFDDDEDEIIREYNVMIHQKGNQSSPLNKFVIKLFLSDIFCLQPYYTSLSMQLCGKNNFRNYNEIAITAYNAVIIPPPIL